MKRILCAALVLCLLCVSFISGVASAESVGKTVVCVGDGLPFGAISDAAEREEFSETLSNLLSDDFDVLNFIRPASSQTEDNSYLDSDEYQSSIDAAGDMYVILSGTDTGKLADKWDAETFENNLNTMVNAYKEMDPEPVIVLVAPLEEAIRELVIKVAEDKDVACMDLLASVSENTDWIKDDDGSFTEDGLKAVFQLVSDTIKAGFTEESAAEPVLYRYANGTYTGSARGMGGNITVTISIENDVISVMEITGPFETPGVGGKEAIEDGSFKAQIEEAQSSDIEGIAGATMTSGGVKRAVEDALKQAIA